MKLRPLLFRLHRWAGLFAGLFLLVSGISGSMLVFAPELDQWLNSELLNTRHHGVRLPVQMALERARLVSPQYRPFRVTLPRGSQGVYEVTLAVDGGEPWVNDRLVYVDPYSGEMLGSRLRKETLRGFLWHLHTQWWLGDNGTTCAGIAGLFLFGLCLSGFYVWWPQRRIFFNGSAWTAAKLHRTAGVCSLAVLAPIAITAAALAFSDTTAGIITAFTATPAQSEPPPASVEQSGAPPLALDQILSAVEGAFPGGETIWIDLPAVSSAPYKIRKRATDEINSLNGLSYIYVDRYTGKVLSVDGFTKSAPGARLQRLLFPIHSGAIGGIPLRAAYLIAGVIPALLFITGYRKVKRW